MEFIKCPVGSFIDEEVPVYLIFDTLSMNPSVSKNVGCILVYIARNKGKKSVTIISNIIKANIGKERFNLIQELYINTYSDKLKRYFYFPEPSYIYNIMDSFNIIYNIIPILEEVASYYSRKENYERERNI